MVIRVRTSVLLSPHDKRHTARRVTAVTNARIKASWNTRANGKIQRHVLQPIHCSAGVCLFVRFRSPTSKKLRVLVCACLSLCVSVTLYIRSSTVRLGSWNLIYGISTNNKRTRIFFFSVGLVIAELCPIFDFCIVNLWDILNKISGEPLELGPG